MTETHKRRAWFQLHLSTCVVLMCVAAVGVWSNIKPNDGYFVFVDKEPSRHGAVAYTIGTQSFPAIEPCNVYREGKATEKLSYSDVASIRPWLVYCTGDFGWPFHYAIDASESHPEGKLELTEALQTLPMLYPDDMSLWNIKMLVLNAFIWLVTLLLFAGGIEFFMRRRERKRAA